MKCVFCENTIQDGDKVIESKLGTFCDMDCFHEECAFQHEPEEALIILYEVDENGNFVEETFLEEDVLV